jgi:hypothetical protein
MTTAAPNVPGWLSFNVAALVASLAHGFIDFHLGGWHLIFDHVTIASS